MPETYNPKAPHGAAGETAEPEEPKAPTGTSKEVLSWVGDDKDRAQLALDAEKDSEDPRKTLVADLEKVLED